MCTDRHCHLTHPDHWAAGQQRPNARQNQCGQALKRTAIGKATGATNELRCLRRRLSIEAERQHLKILRQALQDVERANLDAFIARKGKALAQEQQAGLGNAAR